MKNLLLILSVTLVSACMSIEKATGYLKEKNVLDSVCATNYPDVIDTSYIKVRDTAYENMLLRKLDSLGLLIDAKPQVVRVDTCDEKNYGKPMVHEDSVKKLHARIVEMRRAVNELRGELSKKKSPCDTAFIEKSSGARLAFCERKYKALEEELRATQDELSDMTGSRNWWRKGALFTWIPLAIIILLSIFLSGFRSILSRVINR